MPKSEYPFPAFPSLFWRNRHVSTGDTTPPTRPGGVPSLTTRIMLSESAPSGDGGGVYSAHARGLGLGENPTSAAINRGFYDLHCGLDLLFEKDNAEIEFYPANGVVSGAGPLFLIPTTTFAATCIVYIGPGGTKKTTGPDPERWCSNYLKLWGAGAQGPVPSPVTGDPYSVTDVYDSTGTLSLYTNLPTNVYPISSPGVIATISAAPNTVTFVGGTPPGGIAADPAIYQCFFNYSLFETLLSTTGSASAAFATCTTGAAGTYTLDRNPVTLGWLPGHYVYLTHYAYNPQLSMSESYNVVGESILACGGFRVNAFGRSERFMNFLRFADVEPLLSPALEVVEPPSAILQSFDYGNALFRGVDYALKGTVGFDFQGSADTPGVSADAYAGFLHRKAMNFNSAGNTIITALEVATWAAAGPSQFTVAGAQLHGAAPANTNLLPGIDLVQVADTVLGTVALLVLNSIVNATHFDAVNLDGTAWVPPVGSVGGWVSIYRPQARTGMWDSAGNLTSYKGGNLFVGDSYGFCVAPAVTLFGVGAGDIQAGWNASLPRGFAGAVDNTPIRKFRVTYTGAVEYSGLLPPPTTCRGRIEGRILPDPVPAVSPWAVGTESWSTTFSAVDEGAAHLWADRGMHFHAIEEAAGPNSTALGLNANATIDAGLVATERSHLWFGFPGATYPLAGIVKAGDRDAGFLYAYNNAGSMEVSLGFTTASALARYFSYDETPTVRNPPAGIPPIIAGSYGFGANPARLSLDVESTFGWKAEKTFYHEIAPAMAQADTTSLGGGTLNFTVDGVGGNTRRVWRWLDAGAGSTPEFVFPVNLPEGVYVTDVNVAIESTSNVSTVDVTFATCAYATAGAAVEIGVAGSALIIGMTSVPVVVHTQMFNNTSWHQVRVKVNAAAGSTTMLHGCRITYTMLDVLPS